MKKLIAKMSMFTAVAFASVAALAQEDAGEMSGSATGGTAAASSGGFWQVITGSGWLGVLLWMFIFGALGYYVYLLVDCLITIKATKIMPQSLISNVESAMAEGDVVKALQSCDNEPCPMANILSAAFSHVEEGYDVIQEVIGTAADLEIERIQQRLAWLSVDGNIAPMLGLLGTVQGMIMAFANLASGAPDVALLAINISQALWTTAFGLVVAIPCVVTYYAFRNVANRIVLRMEAITMELVKNLRNVEVVND